MGKETNLLSLSLEREFSCLFVVNSRSRRDSHVALLFPHRNRFQIVSRVGDDDDNGDRNPHHMLFGSHRDLSQSQVRKYVVREMNDAEISPPPYSAHSTKRLLQEPDLDNAHRREQMIQKVADVSSVPQIALKSVWPWRLVGRIRSAMDRVSAFDGLTKNLPSLEENHPLLEPTRFSFWMAANMSLSQEDKLSVLQMPCTVERLRFILRKVLEQEENETHVCCKVCHSRLGNASELFTVGGAEGTSGAYGMSCALVRLHLAFACLSSRQHCEKANISSFTPIVNEYGVIHQTITLRHADESVLMYSGGPETHDR